jgi:hypothetical protein
MSPISIKREQKVRLRKQPSLFPRMERVLSINLPARKEEEGKAINQSISTSFTNAQRILLENRDEI